MPFTSKRSVRARNWLELLVWLVTLGLLALLVGSAQAAHAQQQIDPATQVEWSLITFTGAGAPTSTCPSASIPVVQVGQPAFNLSTGTSYTCGSGGWTAGSGGGGGCATTGCTYTGYIYGIAQAAGFDSITAWGDSLTVYPTAYCSPLAVDTNRTCYALGVSGQPSGSIGARANAYAGQSQQTFGAGFSIPTTGSVTVTWGNANYNPTYGMTAGQTPYYPNGVEIGTVVSGTTYDLNCVNVTSTGNTATCTPVSYPGSPVAVANGNHWLAVLGAGWGQGMNIFRVGRNNFSGCPTSGVTTGNCQVAADVAALVAAYPRNRVVGLQNGDSYGNEYTGQTGYLQIIAVNTWEAATYAAAGYTLGTAPYYSGTFVDARSNLVAQTCAQPGNADSTYFCSNSVPGLYVRAIDGSGTLTAAITSTTAQAYTTSAASGPTTLIGTEYIENQVPAGGGTSITQSVRGFNGSTAATHLNGAAFTSYDFLHESTAGYALDATQIAASLNAEPVGNPYMTLVDVNSLGYATNGQPITANPLLLTGGTGELTAASNGGFYFENVQILYGCNIANSCVTALGDGTFSGWGAINSTSAIKGLNFQTFTSGYTGTAGMSLSVGGLADAAGTTVVDGNGVIYAKGGVGNGEIVFGTGGTNISLGGDGVTLQLNSDLVPGGSAPLAVGVPTIPWSQFNVSPVNGGDDDFCFSNTAGTATNCLIPQTTAIGTNALFWSLPTLTVSTVLLGNNIAQTISALQTFSAGVSANSVTGTGGLTASTTGSFNYGTSPYSDTGLIEQLTAATNGYIQAVIQNTSGGTAASADWIVGNANTTATTNFGDFGMNGSGFTGSGAFNQAGNVYVYSESVDLAIGTFTANALHFVYDNGAADTMTINANGVIFPALATSPSTAALCLDGTGGALTNVGCAGGGSTGWTSITGGGTNTVTTGFQSNAPWIFAGAGAASVASALIDNGPYTGGSASTNWGELEVDGSSSVTHGGLATAGNMLNIDAVSAFTGNLITAQLNGAAPVFNVTGGGALAISGSIAAEGAAFQVLGSAVEETGSGGFWSKVNSSAGFGFGSTEDTNLDRVSAGVVGVGTGTAGSVAGTLEAANIETTALTQQAASNTGGTCPMSTSTSCTITISHTYTTPLCIATQQSGTLTGGAAGCTLSGTTVTITAAVANSETWAALVFGNPN